MQSASKAAGRRKVPSDLSASWPGGSVPGDGLDDQRQTRLETEPPGTEPQDTGEPVPELVVQVQTKLNRPALPEAPLDVGAEGPGGWCERLRGGAGVAAGAVAGTAAFVFLGVPLILNGELDPGAIAGRVAGSLAGAFGIGVLTRVAEKIIGPHCL
ncbi:MAG: hypothetical protein GXD23_04050 [Comamonadaceae bacterium]|jgi:hypothetical protein|uniref:hypothetical protein n=1 Tax=Hydrogenophaga TaxID=47420 RepID=UPI0011C1427F|nr:MULTISPECIES: hypothetical protein [Hydrogenophaga]NCT96522.1 hypothetical protein [Comamonadaceae bacterium]WQB84930.1 hypothetical protein SOM08_06335 [Hydrogenophaga sp. SNF1]